MAQTPQDLPVSIGRFRIESRLGAGGMGEVYKGFDPGLMRSVAVKTVRPDMAAPEYVERLYREAQACARLQHPNIVTIYEVGEFESGVFIAMEFLKGQNLATAIEQGVLSLESKLTILGQILDALSHAHDQQVVHRDVKPSNVHLMPDGSVKLLDFGLARLESADTLTLTGAVMGTPHYASPEQLRAERVDARSDIFSVGVLAYELLEGKRPFEADSLSAVLIKVLSEQPAPALGAWRSVPSLHAWVETAMAKLPVARFQSARQMREALALLVADGRDAIAAHDAMHPPSLPPAVPQAAPPDAPTRDVAATNVVAFSRQETRPSEPSLVRTAATSLTLPPDLPTTVNATPPTVEAPGPVPPARGRGVAAIVAAVAVLALAAFVFLRAPGEQPSQAPAETVASTPVVSPDSAAAPPVATEAMASTSTPAAPAVSGDRAERASTVAAPTAPVSPPPAPATTADAVALSTGQARQLFLAASGVPQNTGLKWRVIRKLDSGEEVDADPEQTFHSGDRVRLAFESNIDGFLYVAHQGSSKRWVLLFPAEGVNGGSNAITRGTLHQVPDNGWFRFDDTPGEEELFVVLSRERLADMPGFQGRVRRADSLPPRAVDDLRLRMASRDLVFEKDPPARAGTPTPSLAQYVVNRDELGKAVSATIRLRHAR